MGYTNPFMNITLFTKNVSSLVDVSFYALGKGWILKRLIVAYKNKDFICLFCCEYVSCK